MAQKQLKNSSLNKRNPMAIKLTDGRYHQRVVKNKKVYNRKKLCLDKDLSEKH